MECTKQQLKEAILKKCLDCCGYNPAECESVTEQDFKEADYERVNCTSTKCPLFEFRFGSNPYKQKRKYTITDAERERRKGNFK